MILAILVPLWLPALPILLVVVVTVGVISGKAFDAIGLGVRHLTWLRAKRHGVSKEQFETDWPKSEAARRRKIAEILQQARRSLDDGFDNEDWFDITSD